MNHSLRRGGPANWTSAFTLRRERNNYEQIEVTCQLGRFTCEKDTEKKKGAKLSVFKQKILNSG